MERDTSAFSIAVEEFATRPTKKKKDTSFIHRIWARKSVVTIDDAHHALSELEKASSQRASRRILRPVYNALQDYYKVIDTLISADPMPSAFVWGGLKAVIECFGRYNELFEKLESQMKRLENELKRLSAYEKLFRESAEMQGLLIHSYLNILEFWVRVEAQCTTSGFILTAKSLTSFSTKKIDEILAAITNASNDVDKLVPIVQERRRRGEHEDITKEWRKAGFELERISRVQIAEREERRRQTAKDWIERQQVLNGSSDRHHNIRIREFEQGTGNWLFEDARFRRWEQSPTTSSVIWLNGGPGVGKSFICSHAVNRLQQDGASAVAFQYFTHEETDVPPLLIYRNIANQLFHALYGHGEEISEHIDAITQGQLTEESIKYLIEVLVAELNRSFVFLDGIDEECSEDGRWRTACQVLKFFVGLAHRPGSTMKLWCSSQYRTTIKSALEEPEQIQLMADLNAVDIERFFERTLDRDFEDLDQITKIKLLKILKQKVDGNFLWAAMMLKTISNASSSVEVQRLVEEGMPLTFQEYLEKKIKNTERSQYGILCKVLSCLVYAKRPLLLEELCEAIQISGADIGKDLSIEDSLFRKRLMANCEALVRFDQVATSPGRMKELCTLWHGTLRKYLQENPDVLSKGNRKEYLISPVIMSLGCLKYLQQPRYGGLLSKVPGSFSTINDEDILDHHFLSYSAKYWRRHMDDIDADKFPDLYTKVGEFIASTNFITCLQVQSLLVDGWFQFYLGEHQSEIGIHLVRAFPEWFIQKNDGGERIYRQYNSGIGEWGYYLDKYAVLHGKYPGQLDRCWWSSLGKHNFLSKIQSCVKSFVLEKSRAEERVLPFLLERLSDCGSEIDLYKLEVPQSIEAQSLLICERWTIAPGRSPKLATTQEIIFSSVHLELYLAETKTPATHRSQPLIVSRCGKILQIGSLLYHRDPEGVFNHVPTTQQDHMPYVDEISCRNEFIAIASRRKFTKNDLGERPLQEIPDALRHRKANPDSKERNKTDSGTSSDSDSVELEYCSEDSESGSETDNDTGSDRNTSENIDMAIGSRPDGTMSSPDDPDSDCFEVESIKSLSAFESMSEGSTEALSDEIGDNYWDNFDSDNDDLQEYLKETRSYEETDGESDERGQMSPSDAHFADMDSFPSSPSSIDGETESSQVFYKVSPADDENDGDSERYSRSHSGSDDSDLDSDSNDEARSTAGKQLSRLLNTGKTTRKQGGLAEIRIFKMGETNNNVPQRVFRFFQNAALPATSSPPVFHPTEDLVVWPLGDSELLFADFTGNTYFIRKIDSGYKRSCQISCHCHFSLCGQYLHIASLDGYVGKDYFGISALGLRLHITTHRLRGRKLTRSPPRLIYRTALILSDMYTISRKLSKLPYTLTWTETHVFVTESQTPLKVYRVPLYRQSETKDKEDSLSAATGSDGIYVNTSDVFLPFSALARQIHFFERCTRTENKSRSKAKSKTKDTYAATVLISPLNHTNKEIWQDSTRPGHIECGHTLPQGAHLTTDTLGEWRPIESSKDSSHANQAIRAETWRGGLMHAKVEKFDNSEDCDIVPYIGF